LRFIDSELRKVLLWLTIALGDTNAILPVSRLIAVIASLRQLNMNKTFALVFAASCSMNAVCAWAQQSPAAAPALSSQSPLAPIYACADKTDPVARLACFDAAVAAVKAAEARSDIIAIDKPRAEAVRREAFGFRIPSLPRFGLGGAGATGAAATGAASPSREREPQIEEQTFAVARVGTSGGRPAVFLENGGIWQIIESGEFNAPNRTPFNVRIRSAAMGSYILQVEGRNKGYRVRRLE
jgi:hypothetical protein